MSREHTLAGEATRICALDTFWPLWPGVIIFPACFSYGVQPDAGPSLIFQTLPSVFVNMEGGRLWGYAVFLFMTFASFSTVLAVFEISWPSRWIPSASAAKRPPLSAALPCWCSACPCILGFNVWGDLHLIGARGVQDSEDFLVSNLLLPSAQSSICCSASAAGAGASKITSRKPIPEKAPSSPAGCVPISAMFSPAHHRHSGAGPSVISQKSRAVPTGAALFVRSGIILLFWYSRISPASQSSALTDGRQGWKSEWPSPCCS